MEPIFVILAIVAPIVLIQTARASYHSGRADALENALEYERKNDGGWEDEAKFWRNAFLPDAEAKRIENE